MTPPVTLYDTDFGGQKTSSLVLFSSQCAFPFPVLFLFFKEKKTSKVKL